MPHAALEPGSFVHGYCTRCKAVLRHTVVALAAGRPVRAKCNTCGGEHVYREGPPSEAAAAPKRRETGPKAGTTEAAWKEQLTAAAARGVRGRPYAATEGFLAGDVMDHPAFGPGIVQRSMGLGKILVLFREGARTLLSRA